MVKDLDEYRERVHSIFRRDEDYYPSLEDRVVDLERRMLLVEGKLYESSNTEVRERAEGGDPEATSDDLPKPGLDD